ncbi:MAG: DUF4860 domain-containing protein [Oscillospiraceae bacterium]|nr:DUF4860 domain-containing protein [Oscillospiraceae bacterium]
MKQKLSSHAVSGLFVFLLLGVFAVFSTVMVLLGVKAYRGAVERSEAHNASRIASAYIRSMLRADDEAGAFSLESCEGLVGEPGAEQTVTVNALTLRNDYGEEYITRIYVYDGFLREWFTRASEPFYPDRGEVVCPAEELTAEIEGSLLTVHLRTGNTTQDVLCSLRVKD